MERDLVAQTSTVLQDIVGDNVTSTDRASIQSWLSEQLETERAGWKQKLNMAMKEVEKERKLALEVHTAIHNINEKIEKHGAVLNTIHREPSMYRGADLDMKVNHITTLDKHVQTMMRLIDHTEQEMISILEGVTQIGALGVVPRDVVVEHIVNLVDGLKTDLNQSQYDARELEERLTKEIVLLNDTVKMQEDLISRSKEKHLQQVMELGKNIDELKRRKSISSASTTLSMVLSDDVGKYSGIIPSVRECCIQTDLDLYNQAKTKEFISTGIQTDEFSPPSLLSMDIALNSLKPVTEVYVSSRDPSDQLVINGSLKSPDHSSDKRSMDLDQLNSAEYVEALRHQVVSFAQKLEQERWKLNEYEQQMAVLRTNPRCRRSPGGTSQRSSVTEVKINSSLDRQWKSSDGYLCGVRKDLLDTTNTSRVDVDTTNNTNKDKKRHKRERGPGITNTCFRCHHIYRNKENHRMACRYHPKGKQNIERYDSMGKLLKILQVWECCMQQNDAGGCSVGEHI